MKHQHSAPASPRCEPCTDPSHIFLLLSQPCPPPYPITSPGTSVSLPDSFPLFCCPQIPGCFGGAPGSSGSLVVPPALKPGCRADGHPQGGGRQASSVPLGNFPASNSPLAGLCPPLVGFLGRWTASLLLAFHSHAEC